MNHEVTTNVKDWRVAFHRDFFGAELFLTANERKSTQMGKMNFLTTKDAKGAK